MGRISYLEFSNRDMEYAVGNYKMGFYNPCGRFCHQSIEKRMKYYIELYGNPQDLFFLSTHNLKRLYEKVCEIEGVTLDKVFKSNVSDLTDYYFDTNYPKDFNIELTKDMAKEAIEVTENINAWIDTLLNNHDEDDDFPGSFNFSES